MCEAHAFVLVGDKEELLLENVDEVDVTGDEVRLDNIFGEQRIVKGMIKKYSNSEGKLLLQVVE